MKISKDKRFFRSEKRVNQFLQNSPKCWEVFKRANGYLLVTADILTKNQRIKDYEIKPSVRNASISVAGLTIGFKESYYF